MKGDAIGQDAVEVNLSARRALRAQLARPFDSGELDVNTVERELDMPRGSLVGALRGGQLITVRHLYALCDQLQLPDLDKWDVAADLHLLPADSREIFAEAVASTQIFRIEQYLETAGHVGMVEQIREQRLSLVEEALSPTFNLKRVYVQRGVAYRVPYQTYVRVRASEKPRTKLGGVNVRRHLTQIRELLTSAVCDACVHVETSADLLEHHRLAGELVLIVEAEFDDKGTNLSLATSKWAQALSPVILYGCYYSGAKDLVVLLHEQTGLAALDVSRYVAKALGNISPLRADQSLPNAVFNNAITSNIGKALVITIDDANVFLYQSSGKRHFGRRKSKPGTAVVLRMTPELLAYAGYHIARTRHSTAGQLTETETIAEARKLQRLQDRLSSVARSHQRFVEVEVPLAKGLQSTTWTYGDGVDEMFDVYRETAAVVLKKLEAFAAPKRPRS